MGFCHHHAVEIIAESNYALWKVEKQIKLPQHSFSSIFPKTQKIDRESNLLLKKKKSGVTVDKIGLNSFIYIKMPTYAIYLYNSSTALALNAWRGMNTLPELRAQ